MLDLGHVRPNSPHSTTRYTMTGWGLGLPSERIYRRKLQLKFSHIKPSNEQKIDSENNLQIKSWLSSNQKSSRRGSLRLAANFTIFQMQITRTATLYRRSSILIEKQSRDNPIPKVLDQRITRPSDEEEFSQKYYPSLGFFRLHVRPHPHPQAKLR